MKTFDSIREYGGPKISKSEYLKKGKEYHAKKECKDEVDFKPHMMYNPKTGEGVKANTYADHVKLDKKGYTHEKPEVKESGVMEATVPRKDFEALKKGDKVTVHFDSSMKKGHKETLVVKSKSRSNKYNVDKVTMGSATDSRNRTKFILYSRGGKDATLAWGDMGVSLTKFVKEETTLKTFEQIREARGKSDYPLYHKTYSGAMAAAYELAKKKGYTVSTDDIDRKVAMGPKKPSSGKTNSFTLKLDGEKKKMLAVQVTNLDNKRYELNTYIT